VGLMAHVGIAETIQHVSPNASVKIRPIFIFYFVDPLLKGGWDSPSLDTSQINKAERQTGRQSIDASEDPLEEPPNKSLNPSLDKGGEVLCDKRGSLYVIHMQWTTTPGSNP
jgi:hypothetical protein